MYKRQVSFVLPEGLAGAFLHDLRMLWRSFPMTIFFGSVSGRKGGIVNRRNHSFVMESKLHDVKGRVDYISSPKRQENLYAVFSNVEGSYWDLLAEQNQRDFAKSGTEGTCIEARELITCLLYTSAACARR